MGRIMPGNSTTYSTMANNKQLVACPSCDLLQDMSALNDGERAYCSRCNHFLTRQLTDDVDKTLAYTLAAAILLIIANCYPFLSFKSGGIESVMTLPQTAWALYMNGMADLAILVAAFIIMIPAILLALILMLYIPIFRQTPTPWLSTVGRMVFTLQNWSMVEVFLIGVIVSLVKIAGMATVVLGLSFWAYVGFTLCFTLVFTYLDRYQCWLFIDKLQSQ
jgi:paraquat-inducible protein A